MPFVVCLPRGDIPLRDLLRVRTHPQAAAELAQGWSTPFPDGATGTARLLRLYERSALAGFHRQFISSPDSHAEQRRERNEQLDVGAFPRCVAAPLLYANDWLLKPTYLQVLARVLWALGWEPRQIADLVHSRYQDGCGWGNTWMLYDAGTRADFWVRVMTGLVVDGTDDLADFNCVSQAEKGYCPQPFCGHNLALYRDMLLKRLQ